MLNIGLLILFWIAAWISLKGISNLNANSIFDNKIGYGIALGINIILTVATIPVYLRFKRDMCAKK